MIAGLGLYKARLWSLLADSKRIKAKMLTEFYQIINQSITKTKMKLNITFFIIAVLTLVDARFGYTSHIVTGPLGCGSQFHIKHFRGRTIAIPLDPECQVGPASDLGRQQSVRRYGPVNRRFMQNWSRFIRFTDRQNAKFWINTLKFSLVHFPSLFLFH